MKRILIFSILILGLTSCNSENNEIVKCINVPSIIQETYNDALTADGNSSIINFRASKYNNLYYIAGELKGPGFNNETLVFLKEKLNGSGLWYSANTLAKEFTGLPKYNNISYEGIELVKNCIK